MKKIALLTLVSILFYSCAVFFKLKDLRPENMELKSNQNKAKQLIHEMGVAHGICLWDSAQTYTATFGDEFYGFFGKQSHPFKEQKMEFSLSYIPNDFNGQLEVLNGKEKGVIWGIQSGQTYKLEGGKAVLKKNKDMQFWIPTYQYFIEFPKRIQEATVFDYIGSKEENGVEIEGIIASWGTIEPQKEIDQYIIWLNANTKRIAKVEYTVRDVYGFVSGIAHFNNYKYFDGFLLPTEFLVESNLLKKGLLHKMSLVDFKINRKDISLLLPIK